MPSSLVNVSAATTASESFGLFIDRNARNLDVQWLGKFANLVTAGAVASGSPLNAIGGITKFFIVVNAGLDINGTLTATGTKVNRNTGAESASSENITIDTLTTDNSDTDAEGNVRHAFSNAYITNDWYKGTLTFSTTDLDLSDVDIYGIAFEQFNDIDGVSITTLDSTLTPTNTAAWMYTYCYKVAPVLATKKCSITREITFELVAADVTPNVPYRKRLGNQAISILGSREGIWIDLFFGPSPQAYWDDINFKLWYTTPLT